MYTGHSAHGCRTRAYCPQDTRHGVARAIYFVLWILSYLVRHYSTVITLNSTGGQSEIMDSTYDVSSVFKMSAVTMSVYVHILSQYIYSIYYFSHFLQIPSNKQWLYIKKKRELWFLKMNSLCIPLGAFKEQEFDNLLTNRLIVSHFG